MFSSEFEKVAGKVSSLLHLKKSPKASAERKSVAKLLSAGRRMSAPQGTKGRVVFSDPDSTIHFKSYMTSLKNKMTGLNKSNPSHGKIMKTEWKNGRVTKATLESE